MRIERKMRFAAASTARGGAGAGHERRRREARDAGRKAAVRDAGPQAAAAAGEPPSPQEGNGGGGHALPYLSARTQSLRFRLSASRAAASKSYGTATSSTAHFPASSSSTA